MPLKCLIIIKRILNEIMEFMKNSIISNRQQKKNLIIQVNE